VQLLLFFFSFQQSIKSVQHKRAFKNIHKFTGASDWGEADHENAAAAGKKLAVRFTCATFAINGADNRMHACGRQASCLPRTNSCRSDHCPFRTLLSLFT